MSRSMLLETLLARSWGYRWRFAALTAAQRAFRLSARLLVAATVWSMVLIDPSVAQAQVEEPRDRPGLLALLTGSLMLVTWAIALGIALHRARNGRETHQRDPN